MANAQLDVVRRAIRDINLEAEKTVILMKELDRILSTGREAIVLGDAEQFKAANNELIRYTQSLKVLQQQRQAAFTGGARQVGPGALTTAPRIDLPEDQGVNERIAEFERVLGRSGKSAAEAAQFLRQYGFEAKNIKRVMIDPITGTRQFTAELRKADGIIQRATFAVDRFGNVVGDSGTRFKGFSDMISRNVVKVLEWAVAVGVVYGALSQLNQVFDTLVELDEVMSDITITTQQTGEALNQYFESAVVVARETGIAVRDVLSVYDDALRATATLDDESERLAVSTALLNDAMSLSRLTGLDVSAAMDSLTGALKQVSAGQAAARGEAESIAEAFQRGEDVLGTWILAARDGQVALDTFATTFAITGAAAGAAGLNVAELTALTSVLAEGTVKSSSEVGNSIRRMLTTIQSESSVDALRDIGVAVEDLNGEMRDWDEIMTDLASRRRAGAITDAAFRQVTYALGGGPRGAADISFTIESWDQVIAKSKQFGDSAAAQEAKQAALAAKSETLKNAINDLNTSFTSLVQTLGTEGGLLDTAQVLLEVMSGIVDGLGLVTEALGPATTRVLALTAAMAVLNNTRMGMGLMRGLEGITRGGGQLAAGLPGVGGPVGSMRRQAIGRLATPQMAIATGYALSQLSTEGDAKEKAVRVGTTLAGAVIGALTPAGPIIGAAIGDAAGNALLSFLETNRLRSADIVDLDTDDLAESWASSFKQVQAGLSYAGGLFQVFEPEESRKDVEEFFRLFKEEGEQAAREFAMDRPLILETPGQARRRADELVEVAKRMEQIENLQEDAGQTTETQRAAVEDLVDARDREIRRVLDLIRHNKTATRLQQEQLEALEQYASGDLPKKAYTDFGEGIQDALNQGATAFDAFSDAAGVGDDFLDQFLTRYAQMLPEVRDEFMALVTAASQLEEALEGAMAGGQTDDAEYFRNELKRVNREMVVLFELANNFDKIEAFQFKGFTDFEGSAADFQRILEAARAEQERYAEQLGIDPEDMVGSVDEWVAHFEDIYQAVNDIHQQFVKAQIEQWKEARKEQDFNLQRLRDISPEKIPELEQRVNFWRQYLSRVPGYEQQAEEQPFNLILGEEDVFHRLITTQEALRFAIEDLTEVEEKQLEGMWNIPEGATVMVPLQSLYYAPKQGGGELGLPDVGPYAGGAGDLGLPADKMSTAGDKMDMAADKMLTASELQQQQSFMWGEAVKAFPEGFGPEESMWNKAVRAFPTGGFGPEEAPEDKLKRTLEDAYLPTILKGGEDPVQNIANTVPPAVKEGFQGVQIEIPPIDARISINIPAIRLNGKAVSSALSIERTSRLSQAARARGMSGGGVVQ